jgi:CRP-like cAMP-binding protein
MKVKADPGTKQAEVLDLLGVSSWFGALPPGLQRLIIDRSVVRKYRRNQVIVRQDEPTRGIFCVLRGRVRGVNRLSDGSEVLIHIGELGSWFAVYSMLANDVSIGSVVADCPVTQHPRIRRGRLAHPLDADPLARRAAAGIAGVRGQLQRASP